MKAIFILEGKLDKSHQCALSEAMDVLAKDWGLSSYLDDVLEDDNICEHNNTITNECSDCNEQELKDYSNTSVDDNSRENLKGAILECLLPEIRDILIDCNSIIKDKIFDIGGQWSKSDYDMLQNGLDDEIINDIMHSFDSFLKKENDNGKS